MLLADIFSMILRLAELAFAAIVAGITGNYLHSQQGVSAWDLGRFIYAEVVAGLSIIFAIIWLLPFSGSFIHWPADLFISIMWWVVFGLLVNLIGDSCGYIFNWNGIAVRGDTQCPQFKADIAFAFLSALCWLVSAILGFWWVRHRTRSARTTHTTADPAYARRRRFWYRSRV